MARGDLFKIIVLEFIFCYKPELITHRHLNLLFSLVELTFFQALNLFLGFLSNHDFVRVRFCCCIAELNINSALSTELSIYLQLKFLHNFFVLCLLVMGYGAW